RQAANLAASLCRPKGFRTAFFFDFVGGMVDFERVHVYNSIHRRIGCRYGKSPTEAGLVQGVGK
ncbi:hypothetical protein C3W68_001419, partial [Neisseria gonorrhoeae]